MFVSDSYCLQCSCTGWAKKVSLLIFAITFSTASQFSTHFKFGQYIQRGHPNKSPLKILEKNEHGRIRGKPHFQVSQ